MTPESNEPPSPPPTPAQARPIEGPVAARPVAEAETPLSCAPAAATPIDPMRLETVEPKFALHDALLMLFVWYIPFYAAPGLQALLFIAASPGDAPMTSNPLEHYAMAVQRLFELAVVIALAMYFCRRHAIPARAFGITFRRPLWQIAGTGMSLFAAYASLIVTMIPIMVLISLFGNVEEVAEKRMETAEMFQFPSVGLAAVTVLLVGFHEELVFRGMLIPFLRRYFNSWTWAIVGSSLLFGLGHLYQGPIAVLQIAMLGATLGLCFYWTRSLAAVALAHGAFDFIQMQLMQWIPDFVEQMDAGADPNGVVAALLPLCGL